MDSERVTPEPRHWVVPLYFAVSALTIGATVYLAFMMSLVLIHDGLRDYCYHGGGGELIGLALYVGWPVIALHVVLSFFAASRVKRSTVVAVTSVLPIFLLIGGVPCI